MNYTLRIAGKDIPVTCEVTEGTRIRARVGQTDLEADFRVISAHQIHLEVDGKGMNVFLADDPAGKLVNVGGTTWLVQDADALAQAGPRRKGPKDLPQEVTPPMPSVVVRILAAQGERVEKGRPVVVVSAMKMETTLSAPFPGIVTRINCAEGDKVMPGQILVDIERDEGPQDQPEQA
ncbi:MAG TPA: biotin/lipoyl-binding protein [Deltaproteobacteria bacterium]|nr:biotin/lipoyl-binding protein [Deltaproteobacteria bacterium]